MRRSLLTILAVLVIVAVPASIFAQGIAIEAIQRTEPVDFQKEILPILAANCTACHSGSQKQSGLVLETPDAIKAGGDSGPSVVPGKPDESLLLMYAAHQADPFMPPPDNKVNAKALTPTQLGLIKLWIEQGAGGVVKPPSGGDIQWTALPPGVNPIYAVAVTDDGQYAACGRANQIFIYHVPTGREIGRLTDFDLITKGYYKTAGVAQLDVVSALTFSPDGDLLASGDFQAIKIWRRPHNVQAGKFAAEKGAKAIAVSPDATLLAAAGDGAEIALFDLAAGQPAGALAGHAAAVNTLQFSADGQTLYSGSADKSIRIWNVAEKKQIGRVDAPTAVRALTVVGDGTQLATAGGENVIRLWSLAAAAGQSLASAPQPATALASSGDGKLLAFGSAEGKIVLVDVASGNVTKELTGHTGAIASLEFSANNARLISGSADKTVRVWDVAQGTAVAAFPAATAGISGAALDPGGTLAVSASGIDAIVWKLDAAAPRPMNGENGEASTVAALSADGALLAVAGLQDGKPAIHVRDVASGNITRTIVGHEGPVTALAISPDKSKLLSGSADNTARVWNLADGAELIKFAGHAAAVTAAAFNNNATQAVTGSADNSLKLWNVADAVEVKAFAGHAGAVTGALFTSDNAAIVSTSADKTLRVWNPADGAQLRMVDAGAAISALALTRDNLIAAVACGDNSIKTFQVADVAPKLTLAGLAAPASSVSFSPDNLRILAGAGAEALVWDAALGKLLEIIPAADVTFTTYAAAPNAVLVGTKDKAINLHTLRYERHLAGIDKPITDVLYHPNGSLVYVACDDGAVKGFSPQNGQQAFTAAHGAAVHDLALSQNQQFLASAGENKEIRVWNPGNGQPGPKPQLGGFTAAVKSVAFTLDNLRLIGGGADGQVLVFELQNGTIEQGFGGHCNAAGAAAVELLAPTMNAQNQPAVVSAAADKVTLAWQPALVRAIPGHGGPINSLATLPSAKTQIVSGSEDGSVRQWETQNGQEMRNLGHGAPVVGVAVRADGKRFASVSGNNTAKLWNAENNQLIKEQKGDYRAAWQVTRLTQQKSQVVDPEVTARTAALDAAQKAVPPAQEAAKTAATAMTTAETDLTTKKAAYDKAKADKEAADKVVADAAGKVKEATDAVKVATDALNADQNNETLKTNKATTDAALAAANTALQQAQQAATNLQPPLEAATKPFNDAEAAFNNAKRASEQAAADAKKAEEAVPAADAALKAQQEKQKQLDAALAAAQQAATATEKPLASVAFSPDGLEWAVAAADNLIHTYSSETGDGLEVYSGHAAPETGGAVHAVVYVSDMRLASGAADKQVIVWDTKPLWALERTIGGTSDQLVDRVISLDFSPDGKLLASGGGEPSRSGELKLWNVADGTLAREIKEAHSDAVFGVEFSPEGDLLASCAADKFVKVWNAADGAHVKSFEGHTHHVLDVSWRVDGKFLTSVGADFALKSWDMLTGEQAFSTTVGDKQITSAEYVLIQADGTNLNREQLLITSGNGQVMMRQFNNNNSRGYGGTRGDYMYSVDVTYDGRVVVAGGQDSVLFIWNGQGQPLQTFEAPKPPEAKEGETAMK